ncbi:MAG: 23S rRNA (uracil(1939)-C(5))-methyltransferase RlmD, partial [Lachnospiraceae bacterium]|nr:23S rRNA (uracil(1939)-C(5))-methyltransferase RlmD [Lachnospiraceae bacterium]
MAKDLRSTVFKMMEQDVKREHMEESKRMERDSKDKSVKDNKTKKEAKKKPKSRCPYSKKCGGCQFVDVPYDKQLKKKQQNLQELLGEFGKLEPIIGMDNPDHYRNKVHAVFGLDQKHRPIAGVYEEKTHRVVDVESCFLENEKSTAIIRTIKNMIRSFKIKTYDEDTG